MADSRQQIIGEINGEIQGAVDAFNDAIPQMEKSLVRKINLIIKDLDLNPNGTIKSTIANMKKMRTIEREMAVAFESAQYLGNVEKYTNAYDKTRAIEGKYFDKVLTDYSEPAIMNEIQNQAVSTVTKELTGSNIVANVIDPVNTLVRQGIESGMEWDDLRSSIGDFLQGVDGGVGALDRYTTTITNDALNTYARTYENTIANREGIEWYEYVGREMTNTRDFCSTLDAQRWFHQSEIKGFLKGRIGKRTVPLYRKTGKPYGMKSSTTEKNFVQLAGGWNCGHHAYPVPTHLVPQKVRDKFETGVDAVDDALGVDDVVDAPTTKLSESLSDLEYKTGIKLDKRFVSKLDDNVELTFNDHEGSFFNPSDNRVNINLSRLDGDDYAVKKVVYHELGHSIHVNKKINYVSYDKNDMATFGMRVTKEDFKTEFVSSKVMINKMDNVEELANIKLWDWADNNRDLVKKNNYTTTDIEDMISSMRDTIGSLTNGKIGGGHSVDYYKQTNNYGGYSEYFAHVMENDFVGNIIFKQQFPSLYDKMIKYSKKTI